MALKLVLENVANLPDGGPVSLTVTGRRGVDIGRDAHLDWTLPDPNRFISGKHCEIRYAEGGYVLTDVSSNGTFVNDEPFRLRAPRRLRDGDRLLIGHYIVAVSLDGPEAAGAEAEAAPLPRPSDDLWESAEAAPEPIDPRLLRSAPERPKGPDFLDWALDVFDPVAPARPPEAAGPQEPARFEEADWLPPPPAPAAPEPVPPPPVPRRPLWESEAAAPAAPPEARDPFARDPFAPDPFAGAPFAPQGGVDARFARRFAEAAGLDPQALARPDAEAFAAELGALMRVVAEEAKAMLQERLDMKRLARAHVTTIEPAGNNPLKFSPTAQDALALMFGPPSRAYLPAAQALREAFFDLRAAQRATLAAAREAAARFAADFDPARIEAEQKDGGLFSSRKARAWEAYAAQTKARADAHPDGLAGVFMLYFAQCYDEARKG